MVHVRGAREDPASLPQVSMAVDGLTQALLATTNDYRPFTFQIPARPGSGAVLTLTSSDTFRPGPSDRRTLGVQVRDWSCAPAGRAVVLPPRTALLTAGVAMAILAVALGSIGCSPGWMIAGSAPLSVLQGVIASRGIGAFAPCAVDLVRVALWAAVGLFAGALVIRHRRAIDGPIQFVLAFSDATLYLKLLTLSHPSMPIADSCSMRTDWSGCLAAGTSSHSRWPAASSSPTRLACTCSLRPGPS
jgi:hypothetical protein